MALVRWEPLREMATLQNEMNRLFGTFFDTPTTAVSGNGPRRWVPAMDLVETDEFFVLRADLPGMTDGDVQLEIEDRVLTLAGERKAGAPSSAGSDEAKGEGYYRLERASGAFSRSLTLPEGVDHEGITARFEHGVLEVRIPKPEERKPRRVAIQVGETPTAIEGKAA
jgi:HSP20 family protein